MRKDRTQKEFVCLLRRKNLLDNVFTKSSDLRIKSLNGNFLLLLQARQRLLQLRLHLLPSFRQLLLYLRLPPNNFTPIISFHFISFHFPTTTI